MGNCFQSICENYEVLRTLWDECLQIVKQPDIKARINGVKTQMEKFNFFFAIQLGERILNTPTIYQEHYKMEHIRPPKDK